MPGETFFVRKFQANTIKFVVDGKVAEARDEALRDALLEKLRTAMDCGPKKVARLLSNADQPTVQQLVAAAQVLGVSVDDLIKMEDAPEA
jgi:transcriptional regulator with XRE-family HTH domain